MLRMFTTSLLESTYISENRFFSYTKHTRSKISNQILDEHLKNTLRIDSVSNQISMIWCLKKQAFSVLSLENFHIF